MKKFLIGLFSGILLCVLVAVIGFFALLRFSERRPSVASQSTLFLKLDGEVPERPPLEIPVPFLESQTPATTADLWGMFEKAAADPRIKALVLAPRNVQAGWGKLQEIHEGLLKFGKSGKPVIACLQLPGAKEYYLATAAGRIYLSREDILDLKGIRVEAMFFKNTLDKLGVKLEVEHAGRYKDAGDAFTRTSMTPETREVLNSVLDGVYGGLVQTIAEGRNKSPDEIRAAIDEGPFLAGQALSKGLVDALAYEDEVLNELENNLGGSEIRRISHRDYIKATSSGGGGRVVALLVADGTILRGEGSEG
ncbi:MAG TPA: S49 family peptidase, partial [Bryobacteraceae bacterium]|nr:S49 family peptidase [Bryobacteraceae bacterium]